jgi:hypothetical protein
MKNDNGYPVGVATLLHIDAMAVAHIQHPLVKRVDGGVKKMRRALLVCDFVHIRPI